MKTSAIGRSQYQYCLIAESNPEFVRAGRKSARQHAIKILDGLETNSRTTKQPKKKNFTGPNMLLTINEITDDIASIRRVCLYD